VMNHDAFGTIQKRNAKACSGKHQRHRDQIGMHVTSPSEDSAHLFFLITKALLTLSFLNKVEE
jgi:hypothetical protein